MVVPSFLSFWATHVPSDRSKRKKKKKDKTKPNYINPSRPHPRTVFYLFYFLLCRGMYRCVGVEVEQNKQSPDLFIVIVHTRFRIACKRAPPTSCLQLTPSTPHPHCMRGSRMCPLPSPPGPPIPSPPALACINRIRACGCMHKRR